jgi:hypothetical protein
MSGKVAIVWDGLAIKAALETVVAHRTANIDHLRYMEALRAHQPKPDVKPPVAIAEDTDAIAKALSRLLAEDKTDRAERRRLAMVEDGKKAEAPPKPKRTGNPMVDWRNQRQYETALLACKNEQKTEVGAGSAEEWPEPESGFGASYIEHTPLWADSAMTRDPCVVSIDLSKMKAHEFLWIPDADIKNR